MFLLNYSTVVDPLLKEVRVYVLEFSRMKAGEKALDVCSGTGDQAFYYARKGIIVSGVERNPHMLQLARKNKQKQGLSNVSFQMGDAQNLPFAEDSFDCVSISFALHENECAAIDRIIAEMKRVVKRDGTLIFVDFRVPLPKGPYLYLAHVIEFMVGRQNYRNFKGFIGQGGLEGVFKRNHLPQGEKGNLDNKILEIVKTKNIK